MAARLPLYERYMRDEEREANRRMRRRDPLKAERQEAFRAGLSGYWRKSRPAQNAGNRFAELANRFAELGHRLINSWWVLAPLGLMCAWAILESAGVFKP